MKSSSIPFIGILLLIAAFIVVGTLNHDVEEAQATNVVGTASTIALDQAAENGRFDRWRVRYIAGLTVQGVATAQSRPISVDRFSVASVQVYNPTTEVFAGAIAAASGYQIYASVVSSASWVGPIAVQPATQTNTTTKMLHIGTYVPHTVDLAGYEWIKIVGIYANDVYIKLK